MDEDRYQLGIRKLEKQELVTLVLAYRNKLMGCRTLCNDFAWNNFATNSLHKVICAEMVANLDTVIEDYEKAMKEAMPNG